MLKFLVIGGLLVAAVPVIAQDSPTADELTGRAQSAGTQSEFAAYDADQSGKLDQAEFSSWFLAKAEQQLGDAGADAPKEDLDDQVALAFTRADSDRDRVVTMQELERFLIG